MRVSKVLKGALLNDLGTVATVQMILNSAEEKIIRAIADERRIPFQQLLAEVVGQSLERWLIQEAGTRKIPVEVRRPVPRDLLRF